MAESSLCRVCSRNFTETEWRKHGYSQTHKDNLQYVLERELKKIKDITKPGELEADFYCFFCQAAPKQHGEEKKSLKNLAYAHLASQGHSRKLTRFWKDYFVSLGKSDFCLSAHQLKKLQEAETPQPLTPSPPTNPAHIAATQQPTCDPELPPLPKTRVSKLGILQNPLGVHEGQRVWGGGIVKIPQKEWIPWPIDLDRDENLEGESFMGAVSVKGVYANPQKQTTQNHNEPQETQYAIAPNLTRIDLPKTPGSNIFTPGHCPPWIKPYELQLFPELVQTLADARKKQYEDRKNPNRIGAAWVAQRMAMGNTLPVGPSSSPWMPNFGRVFNSGPRSATNQEFENEQKLKRKYNQTQEEFDG